MHIECVFFRVQVTGLPKAEQTHLPPGPDPQVCYGGVVGVQSEPGLTCRRGVVGLGLVFGCGFGFGFGLVRFRVRVSVRVSVIEALLACTRNQA